MSIEILSVIAALCLTPNGSTHRENTYSFQLECQQEYIKCVEEKNTKSGYLKQVDHLKECILEKDEK